jgi:hypothetical protein
VSGSVRCPDSVRPPDTLPMARMALQPPMAPPLSRRANTSSYGGARRTGIPTGGEDPGLTPLARSTGLTPLARSTGLTPLAPLPCEGKGELSPRRSQAGGVPLHPQRPLPLPLPRCDRRGVTWPAARPPGERKPPPQQKRPPSVVGWSICPVNGPRCDGRGASTTPAPPHCDGRGERDRP